MTLWAHRIIENLGERSIFEVARDAGCTQLQIDTIFMAAQGMSDVDIAKKRKVARLSVLKTRQAACRRIVKYLDTEVVKVATSRRL